MATFRVLGINHLGLAAKDPQKCAWFLKDCLGLDHLGGELVVQQKTMTDMFLASTNVSGRGGEGFPSRLEIVSPQAGTNDGPISKFIEKKGGGIHHVALAVDNVAQAIAHLKAKGVRLIDEAPRQGAHQTSIAFVHPESTGGILVELVQESPSS
jgi:methylmalonyl-CoA/ethylmalonyl-CoA epimerase